MSETTKRASGVTVTVSGDYTLQEAPVRKRGMKRSAAGAGGAGDDRRLILESLATQDMTLVDAVALDVPAASRPKRRGASAAPATTVQLDVPLGAGEQAAILLEDEGEYRWIVDGKVVGGGKRGGRERDGATAGRHASFSIEVQPAPLPAAPARKRGAPKRGWLVDRIVGKVTAYVFRFAVRAAGKALVARLEGDVPRGLIRIEAVDPQTWAVLPDDAPVTVGARGGGAPRVLLLVHGTFSSTIGSYGALGVTPDGRRFLGDALRDYDVVLGFDHPTLSVDPMVNAEALLARLRAIAWPAPPHFDIVAFSRGGLVTRAMIEKLLPVSGWGATVGRVVFVGCTNGGTQLAEPENWHRFADHYTNLAVGAARLLSFVPGATGISAIADGAVRGLGALIKLLATATITDRIAPGLAAMEPDGDFVRALNERRTARPETKYFAITTDFDPEAALASGATPELAPKLLLRLADWGADEVYGEANDLVVHVRGMTDLGSGGDAFAGALREFGTNGRVYHTNYFAQGETARWLMQWLGLAPPGSHARDLVRTAPPRAAGPRPPKRASKRPAKKAAARPPARGGSAKRAEPSPAPPPGGGGWAGPSNGFTYESRTAPEPAGDDPPADDDAFRVNCNFRAEMDPEVPVMSTTTVDVTISRDALDVAAGRTGATGGAAVDTRKKLIVQISARRNFDVAGERRVEIDVPDEGEEASLSFDVIGQIAGDGELWVQARQGPVPLVTLKLKPQIVASPGARRGRRLASEQRIEALRADDGPFNRLTIEESLVGDQATYHYVIELPELGIRKRFTSAIVRERDAYVTQTINRLGEVWAGVRKKSLAAFETDLRAIGAAMFDELFPSAMRELLWEHRDAIAGLQVFSMEPLIPWELVYLKNPKGKGLAGGKFFGEVGMVRWLYEGYPPTRLTVGKGRVRYVIPTYKGDMELPSSPDEAAMLKKVFGASAVPPHPLDVQKLLEEPGGFDLLHFGGHAEAASTDLADARLLLEDPGDETTENALMATTVGQIAQLEHEGRRPIIVLNACESGRMNRRYTGIGGFAPAFVGAGAGVFIGSHWSVGDAPALEFVTAFYDAFYTKKPMELREALAKARNAARAGGDATWMAYVVYGHPRAMVGAAA